MLLPAPAVRYIMEQFIAAFTGDSILYEQLWREFPLKPKTIAVAVLVIVLAVFSVNNTQTVEVDLVFWKPALPLVLLIYAIFVVGFIFGYGAKGIGNLRRKKQLKDS